MTSSFPESHNTALITSANKKDASSFLHDSNAQHDQRILRLRAQGGWAWYGLYWACVERMREASHLHLEIESTEALAFALNLDLQGFESFLSACCTIGLFEQDTIGYSSRSLTLRVERYQAIIEQKRSAGKISAEKRAKSVEMSINTVEGCVATPSSTPLNGPLNTVQRVLEHPQSNLIQSNLIQSNLIRGSAEGETKDPPILPESDPFLLAANGFLRPGTDPDVSTNNAYMLAARRPMRKYPEIWISAKDLADALKQFDAAGIPRDGFKLVFAKASSFLRDIAAKGGDPSKKNAHLTLTGWAKQEALKELTQSNYLKRSTETGRQ
jgi:hypothetical protein